MIGLQRQKAFFQIFATQVTISPLELTVNNFNFFLNSIKESKYYVKYSESVSKEKLNEVRLYLKTDHLIIQGEKSKKTINCINDLLVDEGFAKVTKGHKAPTNIEPTSKDDDYYNLNILKAHLTTKFAEKDIGRKNLLEELFKQNQNYQEATADPKKNIDILNSLYNVDNEKIDLFENSLEKSNILIDGIRVRKYF